MLTRSVRFFHQLALWLGWALASVCSAQTADSADNLAARARIENALQSVVKIETRSVPNARSNATLGDARSGNGVLIDAQHILTIGYLIMEADDIEITDHVGRKLPAVAVGYDHATGFGLVRLLGVTQSAPVKLGASAALDVKSPVLVVPHGGIASAQPAFVISKRAFTGGWEYMLDEALYTSPPILEWGGAGLFSKDGALVGIGSLFLRNADGEGTPGNMFVPIDLVKPILADLKSIGKSSQPARPWLGMSTDERARGLVITRVSEEGPAALAGVRQGDVIVAVNETAIGSQRDFYTAVWKMGGVGVTVPISIKRGDETVSVNVRSADRMHYFKPRTTL
jgi:serine protease Do